MTGDVTASGYKENLLNDGMPLNYALTYPIERSRLP